MVWLSIWFGIPNNCGLWSQGVGQNREANEKYDEGSVEEEFQLARVKFDINSEDDKEAPWMGYCSTVFEMDQN